MQEWNVRVEDVRVEKRYGKGGKSTKRVKAGWVVGWGFIRGLGD